MEKVKKILLNIMKIFYMPKPEFYENCLYCKKKLVGQQRKFCSISCGGAFHRKIHSRQDVINYKPINKEKRKLEEKQQKARRLAYKRFPSLKGIKCEICGKKAVHRHHENYNNPEDVNFLCWSCHGQIHSGKININSSKEQII